MSTGNSNATRKKGQVSAAALGLFLCASALVARAADYGSTDSLSAAAPLYCYFREVPARTPVPAQPTVTFDATHGRTADLAPFSVDGAPPRPAGLNRGATACIRAGARLPAPHDRTVAQSAPGFDAPVASSPSDLLARLHHAFGTDPGRDVLVRNTDALLRANVRLTAGEEWHGFVYADMGAVDSALRWQGLAGIHGGHGVDLLGGWRHVTYHFTPGKGFDSLEFDGPYLGAALAW